MTPSDLIHAARTWRDVPFLHQGRSRLGVDCIGYIAALCAEAGLPKLLGMLPRNYTRNPQAALEEGIRKHLAPAAASDIGTVLLIQWPQAEHASHAGIFTGEQIIHSYERIGKVVETIYGRPWTELTVGIYRLPGIEY